MDHIDSHSFRMKTKYFLYSFYIKKITIIHIEANTKNEIQYRF